MPNHVTNILEISGSTLAVETLLESIRGGRDFDPDEEFPTVIDFNEIVPMPEVLKNTGSGSKEFDGVVHHQWHQVADTSPGASIYATISRAFTDEELEELAKYPENSWYDWSINNWGTKWNAYDQSLETKDDGDDKMTAIVRFDTAWSAPVDLIEQVAMKYPDLLIMHMWSDEDFGFNTGRRYFEGGDIQVEIVPKGGTREAYELAFEVDPEQRKYYKLVDGEYEYLYNEY